MSDAIDRVTPKTYTWQDFLTYAYIDGSTDEYVYGPYDREVTDELHGSKNPNWREQVASGVSATTNMWGVRHNRRPLRLTAAEVWNWNFPYNQNGWRTAVKWQRASMWHNFTNYDPSTISETKADNRAKTMYVRKIRDMQTTFQGGTFLGELAQTISLIRNPARGLRNGVNAFTRRALDPRRVRRIRNLSLRKRREELADMWLEAQFGWLPLINDLNDAAKALADANYAVPQSSIKLFGVGEHREKEEKSTTHVGQTTPSATVHYQIDSVCEVKYLGAWDFSTYALTAQRIGLDPSSLAVTAWEIVPWSFLIDYFSNVGDVISALSLVRQGERWTCKTVRKRYELRVLACEANISSLYHTLGNVSLTTWMPPSGTQNITYVRRIPYTGGSLVPSLEFSLPTSPMQWLNIAALWAGRRNLRSVYLTN